MKERRSNRTYKQIDAKKAGTTKSKRATRPPTVNSQYREWSPDRPDRHEFATSNDLAQQLYGLADQIKGTYWEQSNQTGLSTSTLRNYHNRKTRNPGAVSLTMMAKARGMRFILVKDK